MRASPCILAISRAGGRAVALALDVADVSGFEAFRENIVRVLKATWGAHTLSGLVNNAGYGLFAPLSQSPRPSSRPCWPRKRPLAEWANRRTSRG